MIKGFATKLLSLVFIVAGVVAAQTTQPQQSLRETLECMQNTLYEKGNVNIDIAGEVRSVSLTDFSECQIWFTYTATKGGRESYSMGESLNLADIDPSYVNFHPFPKGHVREGFGLFSAGVQNDAKKIKFRSHGSDFAVSGISFDMDADYGVRFTKAFKHAVNLCGGKSSITAFEPNETHSDESSSPHSAPQSKQQGPSQSVTSRKDIPTIAKAADGAIVTIVMANGDQPLASGTGFLVSGDGVIVTNYHVIENGNVAIVKFPDGTAFPVDGVLAADKVRDLAIIKIHGKAFRTLTLGNSDQIQVGEEVVAIGNPLGLELTVSNGILSGVRTGKEAGGKLLQITAPITHGSSGGPLFNMMGEVVGITTRGYEGAGNLNFAIPANDAKRLLLNKSATLSSLPNEPDEAPPPKAEPTAKTELVTPLQKDISWMNHFLSEHSAPENTYVIQNIDAPLRNIFKKQTNDDLSDKEGCVVSIYRKKGGLEGVTIISLADIDPAKIEVFAVTTFPILQFQTLYKANKIMILGYADGRFIPPYHVGPNSNIGFDSSESAKGFGRMFRHAVALCGESSEQVKKKTWTADILGGEYLIEVREGEMHISIVKPPSDEAFDKYHIMRTEWVANNIVLNSGNDVYATQLKFHFNRPEKKNGEFVMPCYEQGALNLRVESDSRISGSLVVPTDVNESNCVSSRDISVPITFTSK